MYFRVVDFETSDDLPDGEVIEVGWVDVADDGKVLRPLKALIKPTRPISIETMAVHHLRESDLTHGFERDCVFAQLRAFHRVGQVAYVAHSAKFEQSWWPDRPSDIPWICTYRCAVKLWPDSPRYSNQVLRYYLDLDLPADMAMPPHRAAPDAYVTAHILKKALELASPEELIQWSSEPAILPRVNFGKNRGMSWTEVDDGYLAWILRKHKDFDEDIVHTVSVEMERRRSGIV